MGSDWNAYKVGDVARIQGGYAFKAKDFTETGIPVIKIKNVRKKDIDLTDAAFVSNEVAEQASQLYVKEWDVLISMTGSGPNAPASIVGRVARHSGKDNEFLINQRVGRFVITDNELIDQRFLYYLFSPNEKQLELVSIATGSANQVNISGKQIESLDVTLPLVPEQKAIAHILGSLDDKIELNRQMNETLESMAQALFKSWFVDFDPVIDNALAACNPIPDVFAERAEQRKPHKSGGVSFNSSENTHQSQFPSEFEFTEEMGWIPKGWGIATLENLANISSSKRIFAREYQTEGIPFYRGKEISLLSKGTNLSPEIFISKERFLELKDKFGVPETGDILLTSVGTIGNAYLVTDNDEFYFKDGNLTWFSQYKTEIKGLYIHTWLKTRQAFLAIENIKIGSTQQAITISSLNDICLVKPESSLVVIFNDFIEANTKKSDINNVEISSLTKLRDTLLPKLLSGEFRIPDAEKLIKEAGV